MNILYFLPLIGLVFFLLMLGAIELGFRVRLRTVARHPDASDEGTASIEAAVFALLGLILAFSFSGAMQRLDYRRSLIVQEANDIGTAYLRIDLLDEADQPEMRRLFRDYLDSRIAVFGGNSTLDGMLREMSRAEGIQQLIWKKTMGSVYSEPARTPARMALVTALNDMIDISTTRKVAMFTHNPGLINALLIVIALVSATMAGYAMARRRHGVRSWFYTVMYALVVTATMYVVVDLEYPRAGLITLDAQDRALVELRESMR